MADAKRVHYDGSEYNVVREGLAEILNLHKEEVPQPTKKRKSGETGNEVQSVFYNPIQQFNRDLSVTAIKVFSEDLSIRRRNRLEKKIQTFAKKRKRKTNEGEQAENVEPERTRVGVENRTQDVAVAGVGIVSDSGHTVDAAISSVGMNAPYVEPEHVEKQNPQLPGQDTPTTPLPSEPAFTINVESDAKDGHMRVEEPLPSEQAEKVTGNTEKQTLNLETSTNMQPPNNHKTDPHLVESPKFRILDALSASGLRAIRYAKEIPLATSITANDLSRSATASIALNVRHNGVDDKIIPITSDAQSHMYGSASRPTSKYEVIDLDPYGTAAPFFDSAIQALVDGGLLCVTCTDASIFASMAYLEKTFYQYRGLPFKGQQSHEVGLRLILNSIASSAAPYGIAIEPLLSLSADFYVRLFVRIHRAAGETKFLGSKTMFLYNCGEGCGAFGTQPLAQTREKLDRAGQPIFKHTQALAPTTTPTCEHCDYKMHLAGPMWGGPLHNPYFIQRMLDELPNLDRKIYGTVPRIEGMLTLARDETFSPDDSLAQSAPTHPTSTSPETLSTATQPIPSLPPSFIDPSPLFIHPPSLCKALHCTCPPDAALRGALLGLGYRVTRSHTKAGSIKTDAPWSVIWEVMREWTRQKAPVKEGIIAKGTSGWGLMKRDRKHVKAATLKEEVEAVLKDKNGFEEIVEGLQAALFRASHKNGTRSQERDEDAEKPLEDQEESHLAESTKDSTTNGDGMSRVKDKKLREPNTYEKAHGDPSVDEPSDGKQHCGPTMTRPGHRPLTALQRSKLEVVFDERLGSEAGVKGLVRYQMNPRENWGPIRKAKAGE